MASKKINGTQHVKKRLKKKARIGIGAIALICAVLSSVLIIKHANTNKKYEDANKFSIKSFVSSVESRFRSSEPGDVIKINTSATTGKDGEALGYVAGGGTLINTSDPAKGNTLTLTATGANNGIFSGWTINGTHFGTSADKSIKVVCDTNTHGSIKYDSTNKILYVTDASDIEAVFRAPLKGAENACYVDLYITPNTGHTWIDGGPESWDGYINLDANWYGKDVQLILQYLDGGAARAVVYDENMKQISTSTGHIKDTADCYVNFTVPSTSQNIYCIPRLNQTDNSSFAIFESFHEDYGTAGGTPSSGNAPFTTQLQATPNKGYKFTNWSVYHDGKQVETLTEKNASYYVDGVYKFVANFEEAYWNVDVTSVSPDEGLASITGTGSVKEGAGTTITVVPVDGYEFEKWSYTTTDGITHSGTESTFTINNVTEDIGLSISLKSDKKRIDVKKNIVDGGTATVKIDGGEEKQDYVEVANGGNVTLTATAASGYSFLYWEDKNGNKEPGTPSPSFTYSVTDDNTWTAHFVKDAINIKTAVSPNGAGNVRIDYTNTEGIPVSDETLGDHKDVKSNAEITLTAVETDPAYHFVDFIDSNGKHYSPTSMEVTLGSAEVLSDETYTAIFVPNEAKITVNAEPKIVGSEIKINDDATTEKTVSYGEPVILSASAPGYKVKCWKDQNGYEYKPGDPPECTESGGVCTLSIEAKYGDQVYTVYFIKDTYDLTVDVSPAGVGKFKVDSASEHGDFTSEHVYKDLPSGSVYTITASANTGYEVDKFVDEDGNELTKPVDSDSADVFLDKNTHVTVYFKEQLADVSVVVDPISGGSATVNGKYGSDKVRRGSDVTLQATPAHGYLFKGWKDKDGTTVSTSNPYKSTVSNPTNEFYAVFQEENVNVSIAPDSADNGSVKLYGYSPVREKTTYTVPGSSTIKLEAYPNNGKTFEKWVETNTSQEYTSNPLTIVDVSKDMNFEAVFTQQQSKIEVDYEPLASGSVVIVDGDNNSDTSTLTVDNGKSVIIRATPEQGYTFLYFTDSTGAQYVGQRGMDGGSTLSIHSVTKSEKYTAHFVKKDLTILLESTPDGAGMVRLGNNPFEAGKVQYHVQGNSSIEIAAEPKDPTKYKFERWENKNNASEVYTTNPLTIVSVSETMHYVAVFTPLNIGIKVEAMPASGGQVTKTYKDDGSIVIKAIPGLGYTFANWKKGEEVLTLATEYTIPADKVYDGDVYTAYFKADPNADPRSDITKENFYREWRKISNPKLDVTRDTMQWQAYSTVAGLTQYKNSTPGLRNFAAFDIAREYFEKDMSAADKKRLTEKFGNSELITAEGEILTPDLLPDFENYEAMAEAFTFKKFGKKYDTEILTVKRIYQPTDFDNLKRTYLWRYTGAEYKDNIYLLYNMTGQKEKWATPIVDEDGVLKFTIDDLPNNDVVAVVRVKLK